MLRDHLQEITDNGNLSSHPPLIVAIGVDIPHSIKVLTAQNSYLQYNCVMYAFGIEDDREYIALARHCPQQVHADTTFVQFMINAHHIAEQPSLIPVSSQSTSMQTAFGMWAA